MIADEAFPQRRGVAVPRAESLPPAGSPPGLWILHLLGDDEVRLHEDAKSAERGLPKVSPEVAAVFTIHAAPLGTRAWICVLRPG